MVAPTSRGLSRPDDGGMPDRRRATRTPRRATNGIAWTPCPRLENPWKRPSERRKQNENNDGVIPPPRAGRNFLATHIQSIHKTYLDKLANAYVPASVDRRDPLISPLFANLRGFPPVLIQ